MIQQLYGISKKLKCENKAGWTLVYKLNKLIANIICPLIYRTIQAAGVDSEHEIIVSLTTFPERIDKVWITIASIMNQTYKPKKIILWLAKEQFPKEDAQLPIKLLRLKKRGLEIRYCEDLKPHKKYYFALQQYPQECIVTIDDDVLYPENHLQMLWDTHLKYPQEVCCQYAHKITYTSNGEIELYENWISCYGESTQPDLQLLPVGCGGVLYPPNALDERIFDKDKIRVLCPNMDDLWLKSMEVLKGTKAVLCARGSLIYFDILGTRRSGLQHSNAGEKKNDTAMHNIIREYPKVEQDLYQDYCITERKSNA